MNSTDFQVRSELQQSTISEEVSALIAVTRPILLGLLYALKREIVQSQGGYANIKASHTAAGVRPPAANGRFVPLNAAGGRQDTDRRTVRHVPRFCETEEFNAGYYTPFRRVSSRINYRRWFGTTFGLPDSRGFPGWIIAQQEWHADLYYAPGSTLEDPVLRREQPGVVVAPDKILKELAAARVRMVFKGHDNVFHRKRLEAGETIVPERTVPARDMEALRLQSPLDVFHLADLSDPDSDGQGYLTISVSCDENKRLTRRAHIWDLP